MMKVTGKCYQSVLGLAYFAQGGFMKTVILS